MSEYRYTPQITSSNMRLKDGSNIVFAAEHTFPEYFLQDYLKEGASLELSGLDRFILRMNKKPKEGATISVDANLPMSDVAPLWTLSEQIFKDSILTPGKYNEVVTLYNPPAKFKRTKTSNDENYCFSIKITYNSANRMPIQVTIENFIAPVQQQADRTMQIQLSKKHDSKTVSFWLSVKDWFEFIDEIKSKKDSYLTASFTNSFRKSLIGRKPPQSK